jgi:hypothetical protein
MRENPLVFASQDFFLAGFELSLVVVPSVA